jgi:hypothetical protein
MTGSSKLAMGSTSVLLPLFMCYCYWRAAQGDLDGIDYWYHLQTTIPFIGCCSLFVHLYLIVQMRRARGFALVGVSVSLLSIFPIGWRFQIGAVPYPLEYEPSNALAIRVPMDGAVLVLWGGEEVSTNHHTSTPDQRWAYDLAIEPVFSDTADLADYGCWGKLVRAPISGTVASLENGLPDGIPGQDSKNDDSPLGNHVVLRPESGSGYLVLAHLQKESIMVEVGSTIREAQELARCGRSGEASEPLLHIHYQEQDPAAYPAGQAIGRPLVFRDHGSSPMPKGGREVVNGTLRATGEYIQSQSKTRIK